MSATEIIAEIKKLPQDEQRKIADYVTGFVRQGEVKAASEIRYASDEEFKEALDTVLNERAELLRKLAQ